MNKQLYLIILLLTCRICVSQNLVPNGDFEQYSGCPIGYHDFDSTLFWMNPTTGWNFNGGSPDYFNSCNTLFNSTGVPQNGSGYQPAHSGNAYCGIAMYEYNGEYREYIEVPLTSTLVSNACYHFEMYISLANNSGFTIDTIEAYLSDTAVTGINNAYALPFIPQIVNNAGWIFDTLNWTLIEENIIAAGGENYLIIGNFNNDANTNYFALGIGNIAAYFYIDDVSITPCTGIEEQNQNEEIIIYPNPAIDKLNIAVNNNQHSEIIVYDIASRKLLQQKFTNSVSLNTEQLAKGLYLYEVRNKNGLCKKGKVVKD